jgi:hypothetical protein
LTGLGVSSVFYATLYRKSVFDPLMALLGIRRMKDSIPEIPVEAV